MYNTVKAPPAERPICPKAPIVGGLQSSIGLTENAGTLGRFCNCLVALGDSSIPCFTSASEFQCPDPVD